MNDYYCHCVRLQVYILLEFRPATSYHTKRKTVLAGEMDPTPAFHTLKNVIDGGEPVFIQRSMSVKQGMYNNHSGEGEVVASHSCNCSHSVTPRPTIHDLLDVL